MNNEKLTMNNFLKAISRRHAELVSASASLLAPAFLLASCSVYDNYSEDSYNAFWGVAENDSISSSTTENLSSSVDEASSSSSEKEIVSSSSSRNPEPVEGSSSSSRNPEPVEGSSSSKAPEPVEGSSSSRNPEPVEGSSSSKAPEPAEGSSSSKAPEPAEGSSSSAVSFRCGLDSIADSEEYLGRKYATAKYGAQCWLAENSHRSLEGSKCYGDSEENCEIYGRLYSFDIAKFACPEGTHLPTEEEWTTLQTTVSRNTGGLDLKSSETWLEKPGQSGGKFNAKAAGYYDAEEEEFVSLGNFAGFWSSTDVVGMMATFMYLSSSNQNFFEGYKEQSNFYSVRCLKD